VHKKEKKIRRRERREQRSDEFRLREPQGLSFPATSEYSSLDEEEEESDGRRALPERWESAPPSPRAAEAAEETAPGAGAGASTARQPTREATCVRGGAGARRGDDWGCGGGHVGRGHNARRAPEEEEEGLFHPEVSDLSPKCHVFETPVPDFSFSCSQGGAHRAPLAPAKVLRSDAAVPTRRSSSRAPRAAGGTATAASEGPRSVAAATEPQQAMAAPSTAMTTTVTTPSVPPKPAPINEGQAAVVEIPDDNVPPPG
jgi:hypothetical protein